ncbi:MAG: asparagine synthase (glutamine-hydrolyzing) [Flavobacterium sp.]|nr:asparagine synthase (glutamine-hydrolyzing) [Flavobacterium sp.]
MCGITGFVDTIGKSEEHVLRKMVDTLKHRGPDDAGCMLDVHKGCQIGFGHARLSIIDLSYSGHQPMHFKNFSIVFNGEVYNYQEIKEELKKLNHEFISETDTEVILHAFSEWGESCVERFIGMFSFAIFDRNNSKIHLCRDRAGVKPLFYYWKNGIFLFGSELKTFQRHPAFEKEICLDALGMYFEYGYVPFPNCIFKGANKLSPGHWLIFDLETKTFFTRKYWDVLDYYNQPKNYVSYEEALEEVEKLLKSSFEYRMVADVPVGVFLSGGYDSTAVAAILQKNRKEKLKTFTIGFEDANYNEAPFAREVANFLGTDHTEYYCKYQEAKEIIPNLSYFYDEPFADSSAIPTTLVCQLAKKKVSVVLSADAGDEIFFGYSKDYKISSLYKFLSHIPNFLQSSIFSLLHSTFKIGSGYSDRLEDYAWLFCELKESGSLLNPLLRRFSYLTRPFFLKRALKAPLASKSSFDKLLDLDHIDCILAINYLTCLTDDMLVKVDRAAMSCSLEGRDPLLDHRLIQYVASLPTEYKFDGITMKRILKDIVHKYVPKKMMDRPKSGFGIPIYDWLRKDLNFYLEDYCSPQKVKLSNLFNDQKVSLAIENFNKGVKTEQTFIWQLLIFQMWYERWMK